MTRKRKATILVLSLLGVILGLGLLVYDQAKLNIRRFMTFGPYGHALEYYQEANRCFPERLDEIEEAYNSYERRRVATLPVSPEGARPVFRPIACECRGPFLVMIEPEPSEWRGRYYRFLLYACGDHPYPMGPGADIRIVWSWRLEDLIASDDLLRKKCNESAHNDKGEGARRHLSTRNGRGP